MPAWVWWLVALAAVGAVGLALWLRRRRAWRKRLEEATAEVRWLARELLPQLRESGSPEGLVGGWQVAAPRVVGLEDRLTALGTAGVEQDQARALALRDAVRDIRPPLESYAVAGPPEDVRADLDAMIAQLEVALGDPASPEDDT